MILLCLPMICLVSPTPLLYQVTMTEEGTNSASTQHKDLKGLYWLYKPTIGENAAVFQKIEKTSGKRSYVYRRGADWVVGYDSSSHPSLAKRLVYAIPGLIQFGSRTCCPEDHKKLRHRRFGNMKKQNDTRIPSSPSPNGWLFLTSYREWHYDPSVTVSAHWPRNGTNIFPCPAEDHTDYPGNDLATVQTPNMKTCLSACQQNLACLGVTLHGQTCYLKHRLVDRVVISVNTEANKVQSVRLSCKESKLGLIVVVAIPGMAGLMMLAATLCRRRPKSTRLEKSVEIKVSVIKI